MSGKQYTIQELADLLQAELIGDPSHIISGVADLHSATPNDLAYISNSFLGRAHSPEKLKNLKAGVICIASKASQIEGHNHLICPNPDLAFQKVQDLLSPPPVYTGFKGIHPSAVIHETAKIGKDVTIGPNAVIDAEVIVGEGTLINAGVYIGPKTVVGNSCLIHANATLREECRLGDRITIQPGAVIGSCGFGYTQNEKGEHIKLTHRGVVILEDDVEIGANSAIDRARFSATHIKTGTKIDNLVQIAHNVILGEHNIIAGQTGIAGSSETESHVMIGGQAGVDHHVKIPRFTMIAARSGVSKTLNKPGKYGGVPVMPLARYNRISVLLRNIDKYLGKKSS